MASHDLSLFVGLKSRRLAVLALHQVCYHRQVVILLVGEMVSSQWDCRVSVGIAKIPGLFFSRLQRTPPCRLLQCQQQLHYVHILRKHLHNELLRR